VVGPLRPTGAGGKTLDTDAKLRERGFIAGLESWPRVQDAFSERVGNNAVANAQLWSLQQAIRAHALAVVWTRVVLARDGLAPDLAIRAAASDLGVLDAMTDHLPPDGESRG
jgi:hypothetical protein